MKVRLETATGGFVTEGVIPPFNEEPKVIMWGTRIFALAHNEARLFGEPCVYRECFAYYLV